MGSVSDSGIVPVQWMVVSLRHDDQGRHSACTQRCLCQPDWSQWHGKYRHHLAEHRWFVTTLVSFRYRSAYEDGLKLSVVDHLLATRTEKYADSQESGVTTTTHIGCRFADDLRRQKCGSTFFELCILEWDDNFRRFHFLHVVYAWWWCFDFELCELLRLHERSCIDGRRRSDVEFTWGFVSSRWIAGTHSVSGLIVRTWIEYLECQYFR